VALAALAAVLAVALGGGGSNRQRSSAAASGGAIRHRSGSPRARLLALIPPIARESCKPAAEGVADPSATVGLECGLSGLDVLYQQFPSNAVMDQWYAIQRENEGLAPSSGSCTAARFHGESRLTVGGAARGRYFCVLDSGEPRLYATDERVAVGTLIDYYAGKGQAASASLLRQWRCCAQLGS
jgi:hypothetical protein